MGLDRTAADMLTAAKALGADFTQTLMLGRQNLNIPGFDSEYAEPFFESLGAKEVASVDTSDFEGATVILDLNDPVPDNLRGRFGVVFDGGTLEHVFNIPQALRNGMEMVKPGGFFVSVGPGNNFMGHGFWQTSPEMLFRVFDANNGFETLGVFVVEHRRWWRNFRYGPYYRAIDPAVLGWRVELTNHWNTSVAIIARKVSEVPIFATWPQQSDYARQWEGAARAQRGQRRLKDTIRAIIPEGGERILRGTFNNRAYRRVSREDVRAGCF